MCASISAAPANWSTKWNASSASTSVCSSTCRVARPAPEHRAHPGGNGQGRGRGGVQKPPRFLRRRRRASHHRRSPADRFRPIPTGGLTHARTHYPRFQAVYRPKRKRRVSTAESLPFLCGQQPHHRLQGSADAPVFYHERGKIIPKRISAAVPDTSGPHACHQAPARSPCCPLLGRLTKADRIVCASGRLNVF